MPGVGESTAYGPQHPYADPEEGEAEQNEENSSFHVEPNACGY
jgi:hypothetical protein